MAAIWRYRERYAYVVQCVSRVASLNNLDSRVCSLLYAQFFQDRCSQLRDAERAVACLVEAVKKGDVEACDIVADAQVNVGQRPQVRAGGAHSAAGQRPLRTVVGGFCLVDACACGGVSF